MSTISYDVYKKIIGASCVPVEYIENTNNNAYIDTGLQVINIKGLMVDYQATQIPSRIMCVAGGMRTTADGRFYIQFNGLGTIATTQYAMYGTESYGFAQTSTDRQVVYLDDKDFYYNGDLVNTFESEKGIARHNVFLFAANYGGTGVQDRGFVGKIYAAKLYDNNGLVRDFYPCVNNNGVAGMFDAVNSVFYPSANSDTFAHGQQILPSYEDGLKIMRNGYPLAGLILHKFTVESSVMSLGDKISGDVYHKDNSLELTMQEYVEYNGTKYVLVNPPTIVREGMVSDNSSLNGMTKYSFVFYHPMYKLSNLPFTDIAVNDDEKKYLSQDKTFSWHGTFAEYVAKLRANLANTEWDVTIESSVPLSKLNEITEEVLTFDKQFISDALKTEYDTWKVPFVISDIVGGTTKKYLISFGLPTQAIYDEDGTTPFVFRFGKGLGLKNNSRTPRNNKIVTRLVGYGAERNVPYGYPQIRWYGNQTWKYTVNNDPSEPNSYPIYKGILNGEYVQLIKHPFTRKTLMPPSYRTSLFNKISPYKSRNVNPVPNHKELLADFYDRLDDIIAAETRFVVRSAYVEMKETIEDLVQGGVPDFVQFGDAGNDQYEGWCRYKENGIIEGHFDADADDFFGYSFDGVLDYGDSGIIEANPDYDPDLELIDYMDADNNKPHPINPLAPSVEIHQFEKVYPRLVNTPISGIAPYDNGEKVLSESQFRTRIDQYKARTNNDKEKQALEDCYTNRFSGVTMTNWGGSYTFEFKTVASGRYEGGGWWHIVYTSDNINYDYILYDGTYPPQDFIEWDDTMDEDGNYAQSYFKIILPVLDFDLYACAAIPEEMEIYMRTGECQGCTFPVYVDWDDYKQNFYDNDGNFDPVIGAGHPRNGTKYPDSRQASIEVIVKKDLETFGRLLPSSFQQPHSGDKFVFLGISLPESYILNAENELSLNMDEYILENNVYYYDYPIKIDEYFLTTHPYILGQIKNNNAFQFQYAGTLMTLYIKQISIIYGYKPLQQYNITLADDIEIVLNSIGQVTDDVSRMQVQLSEIQKYYSENIINEINNRLSKVVDDVCAGRITFQQGLTALGSVFFGDEIRSRDYETGLYTGRGWRVDKLGNAEFESVMIRSFMEVVELIVNRMQAQEGDTMFTDNDQIELVRQGRNPNEYILSLKEKYDGYFTSQQKGNILRGIINTLAAKQAGVSDESTNNPDKQGSDDGGNKYYTSWMRVEGTHNTEPNTLTPNQIRVVLYGDQDVPAQKNFAPCELMTIARWGCYLNPTEAGISDAEKRSRTRRQQMFYISASDGRVVKLSHVNTPMLRDTNYGTTLGTVPEFINNWSIASRLIEGRDYLYAQGVIVGDFIKVDINGDPIVEYVDCGEWVDGSIGTPTVGKGIYLCNEKNETSMQFETHDVWHNNAKWRCKQHQPVTSGGVTTYYEPTEQNVLYWEKLADAAKGDNAVDYNLLPSVDKINIHKGDDGSYNPSTFNLTCGYKKSDGGVINTVSEPTGTIDNEYRLFFRKRLRGGRINIVSVTNVQDNGAGMTASGTTDNHDIVRTINGNGSSDGMRVEKVTFMANEATKINVRLVTDCESRYDVAAVGEIDSDELNDPDLDADRINDDEYLTLLVGSGEDDLSADVEVSKGEHFILIAYAKDDMDDVGEDKASLIITNYADAKGWEGEYKYYNDSNYRSLLNNIESEFYDLVKFVLYKDTTHTTLSYLDSSKIVDKTDVTVIYDGDKGSTGERGKTGRFYYYAQEWQDTGVAYIVTDAQAPYFKYNNNYWVFNPATNGTYTMHEMDAPSSQNPNWEIMTNDFKYIITEAIFGSFAHFGSAVISGDWMISTNGTIDGVEYNNGVNYTYGGITKPAYTWFDSNNPDTNTGHNFIPNYAVDLLTGETWMNKAHVRGSVVASSGEFQGTVKTAIMYADNMFISGTYNIDPVNEPAYMYITQSANINNVCVLPPAGDYIGMELRFFVPAPTTRVALTMSVETTGNDVIRCSEQYAAGYPFIRLKSVTSYEILNGTVVTIKAMAANVWQVISGDNYGYTGTLTISGQTLDFYNGMLIGVS